MKTDVRLWQYLAELFSELKIFQIKFVQKIKTRHFMLNNFLSENGAYFKAMWKNMVLKDTPQTAV